MSNLDIWNALGKTDPEQTKQFQRGGGFRGTAIKPIYTEQKMTEVFGPVGTGWGFTEPQFQLVNGSDGQVTVFCWLSLWYVKDGKKSDLIPGVGGDFVVVKQSGGLRTNDEAFKAAFTDAIGNAMKHLGMSADVHMGLFDDSKYVAQRRREEADDDRREPSQSISKEQQKDAAGLIHAIRACESIPDLDATKRQPEFIGAFKALPETLKRQVNEAGKEHREKLLAAQPVLLAGE